MPLLQVYNSMHNIPTIDFLIFQTPLLIQSVDLLKVPLDILTNSGQGKNFTKSFFSVNVQICNITVTVIC